LHLPVGFDEARRTQKAASPGAGGEGSEFIRNAELSRQRFFLARAAPAVRAVSRRL